MIRNSIILLIVLLIAATVVPAQDKKVSAPYPQFWKEGKYCRQDNIDLKKSGQGVIRAKVDGKWQDFMVRQLPDKFLEWNFRERLKTLDVMQKGGMPNFAGPHSGMVASHGFRRGDGQFTVNNAVKGMGFLPKPEHIAGLLAELNATKDSSDEYKFGWLTKLYTERTGWLDPTKQVSLELYATPEYATHTFLNQMTDPGVSIVFLDMFSFEIRAVTQLIDPRDPGLSPQERSTADYVNDIHDYFHGQSPRQSIVAVYHVVEVFNNSPMGGRGKRIVPPLP